MNEFEIIEKLLRPLSGEGSFALTDDVAVVAGLAITKDLLVEGVHFLAIDPKDSVARKALRVNVSDIVAKGCRPVGYFLGLVWPMTTTDADIQAFAAGLATDQSAYGLKLLGGDTTRQATPTGPFTISVTMLGEPIGAAPILRRGARPGDVLMVSGEIGGAGLGLADLQADPHADGARVTAYRLPAPPFALAEIIAAHATASIDISDGLVADAEHLARASGHEIVVEGVRVPLALAEAPPAGSRRLHALITAGDDYQALFTVPADKVEAVRAAAAALQIAVTAIGRVRTGSPAVKVLDRSGAPISFAEGTGYRHF